MSIKFTNFSKRSIIIMKTFYHSAVKLTSGYLYEKQELNRKITVNAVYDRFSDTGRFEAFKFNYTEGGDKPKPHFFWDSDVAKWIEGAAYILSKNDDPALEEKVDAVVEDIKRNQGEDGYFNIYFTVIAPEKRFTDRDKHELYCAGHLMEAAVAYSEAKGKNDFLDCMERYADYIYKVFIEEKSAGFTTPGHEEIEFALIRMYRHTGKKKYLEMAKFFIDERGMRLEEYPGENKMKLSDRECSKYNQSHMPVRKQSEAVGHSVRAMYLYMAMAALAKETSDKELADACRRLWEDTVTKKMYVTGGIGSTHMGECFTHPYDLPNDTAYAETCAAIGLAFFAHNMLGLENDAKYADVIERALYNGVLSGYSQNGKGFFYENPLEINLSERFANPWGKKRLPITERVECFKCSCCPPNIVRVMSSLGNYVYGYEDGILYVNQFISSELNEDGILCKMTTDYPRTGVISVRAEGVERVAVRIPAWCDSFKINAPYTIENGYAVVKADREIIVELDMAVKTVWANTDVARDAGRVCVMRGPIVYCAEGVDNGNNLHRFSISADFGYTVSEGEFGLPEITVDAYKAESTDDILYSNKAPENKMTQLKLIPYNSFANRGESDMSVWIREK